MTLTYRIGDATAPQGPAIIAHVCNDAGGWGRGFVLAISRRWPEPEADYRRWATGRIAQPFALGQVRLVDVAPNVAVANLLAQHGYRSTSNPCPLRYDALSNALVALAGAAQARGATVQMPRIGCGLAGGDWSRVEPLITQHLVAVGVPVVVYDLASSGS